MNIHIIIDQVGRVDYANVTNFVRTPEAYYILRDGHDEVRYGRMEVKSFSVTLD